MIRLNTTSGVIQMVLSAAPAAIQPNALVTFYDVPKREKDDNSEYLGFPAYTPASGTNAVTICQAPGQDSIRNVESLTVFNGDTGPLSVTIQRVDQGTTSILNKASLNAGDLLGFGKFREWYALDNTGAEKVASGTTASIFTPTQTNSTGVSANTTYVAQYIKAGAAVTVSGRSDVSTSVTTACQLRTSLPFSATFTSTNQLGGAGNGISGNDSMNVGVRGDTANMDAVFVFVPPATGTYSIRWIYQYIIP